MRHSHVLPPCHYPLQRTQRMSDYCDNIDSDRPRDSEGDREVAPPRLEPMRGHSQVFGICAEAANVHDPAFGHVPGRKARRSRALAEVSFLETEEVILIQTADSFEHLGPDHDRCAADPVNLLLGS